MLFFFFKKKNTAVNNREIKYIAIFLPKRDPSVKSPSKAFYRGNKLYLCVRIRIVF